MIGGIAFYSFTISMITLFFTSKHNRKTLLEKKIISFEKYVNENRLPSQLRDEIKKFLEYVSHKISYRWDERRRNVIENLPLELKYHFFTEVHREIMLECPFFRTRDINFKVKIMSLMKPLFVKKGNYIWRKNDPSNIIIFIEKGNVDLTINNIFLEQQTNRRRCSITLGNNTPSKINLLKKHLSQITCSFNSNNESKSINSLLDSKYSGRGSHKLSCFQRIKAFFKKILCCFRRNRKILPNDNIKKMCTLPVINVSSIKENMLKQNTLKSDKFTWNKVKQSKSQFDKYGEAFAEKQESMFKIVDSKITNGNNSRYS
jgi:hypothetical protein